MELKSSHIYLKGLRFHAFHGALEQERVVGNDYVVSVNIMYPIGKAVLSDDVRDTLNYAKAFDIIKREMSVTSDLLESVAYRICAKLCEEYPLIKEISIDLRKENPPMGADCDGAGVLLDIVNWQ